MMKNPFRYRYWIMARKYVTDIDETTITYNIVPTIIKSRWLPKHSRYAWLMDGPFDSRAEAESSAEMKRIMAEEKKPS